mmetsp:Transcript_12154/g.12200  ORF Transcript_12154/g.12200 Transcript_12154/m.12200 type:complete len:87 (-) Transcript_12154:160-420(-)
MEDLIVKIPNSGKTVETDPGDAQVMAPKKENSKSTHGSSTYEQEESTLSLLEETLKATRIPTIKNSELIFEELINRGSSCLVFKGK